MPNRLSAIDALRGFAALWVFAYHLWNVFCPGYSRQGTEWEPLNADTPIGVLVTMPVFGFGYIGVSLFFVLSGFCIHYPQARRFQKTGNDQLQMREFLSRRFWRLYPAFFASLFISLIAFFAMNAIWKNPPGPEGLTLQYISRASGFGMFGVNALFLLPLQPEALAFNGVYWTLWYEVQFYLLYPVLLLAIRRFGLRPVGLGLLAFELMYYLVPGPESLRGLQPHFQWFFLWRYFEWYLGVMLAERLASGKAISQQQAFTVMLIGGLAGVGTSLIPSLWTIHELLLAIGSAGLVAWFVHPKANAVPRTSRGFRVLNWFGLFSFSLYLVHMPMMRLLFSVEALMPIESRNLYTFAIPGIACVVIVPTVAYLLYRYFEKPYLPKPRTEPGSGVETHTGARTLAPALGSVSLT